MPWEEAPKHHPHGLVSIAFGLIAVGRAWYEFLFRWPRPHLKLMLLH
jgi:hypothetical protein